MIVCRKTIFGVEVDHDNQTVPKSYINREIKSFYTLQCKHHTTSPTKNNNFNFTNDNHFKKEWTLSPIPVTSNHANDNRNDDHFSQKGLDFITLPVTTPTTVEVGEFQNKLESNPGVTIILTSDIIKLQLT